jgi:CubicO group peptidase (beta-lactamase class C family)
MKQISIFSILMLLLVPCYILKAQPKEDTSALFKKLDGYINSAVNVYKFNGSVLVARKGQIILKKGYGWENFGSQTPNNANTIFQIGSLTKPFTAMVILKLQEEGKLSVNDKLSKYFPEQKGSDKIIIQNLLNHTSGLNNYTDIIGPEDSAIVSHPVPKQKIWEQFMHSSLLFKPGSKFEYCNSDYFLLGMIIEKIAGLSYEQEVRKLVFEPLGMSHSGFDFIHLKDTSKAAGYASIDGGKYIPNIKWDSTVTYSAGAIYSTTSDLYKWGGAIAAGKILSADSWKQAFTPGLGNYGDGWWIDTLFNKKYIYHSGGLPGFMAYFVYYPADDITIILLTNYGNYGDSLAPINAGLSAIMFNEPYSLWEKYTETIVGADMLKQYAGIYQFNTAHQLIITFKGGKLFVEDPNPKDMLPKLELHSESATRFYIKEAQLKFEFVKDDKGNIIKIITYNTHGKDADWLKIK